MNPLVSIIVPTYKRKTSVLRLLKSLGEERYSRLECILVEQGENHGSDYMSCARKLGMRFQYIHMSLPHTAKAKNVGVKRSNGKYIVFLDDDVIIGPGLISKHLKNFSDPCIAAVSGRVLTQGQQVESLRTGVGRISLFGQFSDGYSSTLRQEVDTVIGCNVCWRKDIFERIGGFDEQFTGNAIREESDLSLRAKKGGHTIIFDPNPLVYHLRESFGGTRKTEGRMQWYYDFFSNETYFYCKHRPWVLLPIFLCARWQWAIRCMFGFGREVSMRSFTVPFLGIMDGICKYRRVQK